MKLSDYIVTFLQKKGICHFFGYQGTMIAHVASNGNPSRYRKCDHDSVTDVFCAPIIRRSVVKMVLTLGLLFHAMLFLYQQS